MDLTVNIMGIVLIYDYLWLPKYLFMILVDMELFFHSKMAFVQ